MNEADNIIRILRETRSAIDEEDMHKLKSLSDQTLHSATIYQDPDNIVIAVVVYSLSKIFGRANYRRMDGWSKFHSVVIKGIDSAIKHVSSGNYEEFLKHMGEIRNSINEVDNDLAMYIKDVFYKAGINKAFKLYEHGLSAEKTASLLGVSLWDLAGYIGQSTVSESHYNETVSVKDRIKLTNKFLK